jgi:arginyl-tRNA synthetase
MNLRLNTETILREAIGRLVAQERMPPDLPLIVEVPKEESFGDFTTNVAMVAASRLRRPPREVATALLAEMGDGGGFLEKAEVAGPGFINLTVAPREWHRALAAAGAVGQRYGDGEGGAGKRVQVEFLSANPTGPLHVGHGRVAAVGDVLANLLAASGYAVEREYYINDAGRQMDLLGKSVLARYREVLGQPSSFPEDGYRGEYIYTVARDLILKRGESLLGMADDEALQAAGLFAQDWILRDIKDDLARFGVRFDHWVSERAVLAAHPLEELLRELEEAGLAFREEGALWLRTTRFGDDKDRVLIRNNGQATYFANDILYHREKYRRGYDLIIDIWGADHHGYVERMRAAVSALGRDPGSLRVILVNLVKLLRGGVQVAMSTRAGEFDTLRQVIDEVGTDAARFLFNTRKADSPLDFDLEVAVSQTMENPVYYVQYAHARIRSILGRMPPGVTLPQAPAPEVLARLGLPEEMALVRRVALYPDTVGQSADALEPHRIAFFLHDLASRFHTYYNQHRVLSHDADLTQARLFLVARIGQVLAHGLGILGVKAPENM